MPRMEQLFDQYENGGSVVSTPPTVLRCANKAALLTTIELLKTLSVSEEKGLVVDDSYEQGYVDASNILLSAIGVDISDLEDLL